MKGCVYAWKNKDGQKEISAWEHIKGLPVTSR